MNESAAPAPPRDVFAAAPFEEHRARLRAVAYRLLGSSEEADAAVEDVRRTWPDIHTPVAPGPVPTPYDPVEVLARGCLDRLRSRESRRERPWDPWDPWAPGGPHHPRAPGEPPPPTALDGLTPPERLSFVLHDEFSVPYERIAPLLERTPAAARRLAGRARYRLREAEEMPEPDPPRQQTAVAAFLAAARAGDTAALRALLDPDAALRADAEAERTGTAAAHGAGAVAGAVGPLAGTARKALVDGAAGLAWPAEGEPRLVLVFTVLEDRITAIDALADEDHLNRLEIHV
ncbi:RNA polymerase subunit sigma-70 [Streptomyces sp. NPDC014891]|uniref:RNA polymerase subunit sigma-70 n=1 Tax=Streptomyces sp. NPDC014891 TaxID=3364929 RepID=UPI0036F537FF